MKIREFRAYIKEKETEVDCEIKTLETKISSTKAWVRVCFISSGVAFAFGIYNSIGEEALDLNEFGDFLGGTVASLLSLAGIFYIYMAFLGQKQQLQIQQLELLYNRLEIRESREELKGQRVQLEKQNFESAFYTMLGLYHDIMNSFSKTESGKNYLSRTTDYIKKTLIHQNITEVNGIMPGKVHYEQYFEEHKDELAHYFRVLYRIFKFIDDSKTSKEEEQKWFYIKIVRAQLSEAELFLLFYNAFTHNGENFKTLIVKYNLLKHLPLKDKLEVERFYRDKFRASYEIATDFSKLSDFALEDDKRIKVNYPKNPETIYAMRSLIDGLNYVISATTGNEGVAVHEYLLYDKLRYYFIEAEYQKGKLTLEFRFDIKNTQNPPFHFFKFLGFESKVAIEEFRNMLECILYFKFCHDTFFLLQSDDNVNINSWVVLNKQTDKDDRSLTNSIFASIERTDGKGLELLKDKY